MSRMCTNGRHGVPSESILICLLSTRGRQRLLTTRSNRCRGLAPYAVALRRYVGQKLSSAIGLRSRSTSSLHLAYAVSGLVLPFSSLACGGAGAVDASSELKYTNRFTPTFLAFFASSIVPMWLILKVMVGSSWPTGSLLSSARWTTAS